MKRLYGKFDDIPEECGVSILADRIPQYGFHYFANDTVNNNDTVNDTVNGVQGDTVNNNDTVNVMSLN